MAHKNYARRTNARVFLAAFLEGAIFRGLGFLYASLLA